MTRPTALAIALLAAVPAGAAAQTGLSVSPAVIERPAVAGPLGEVRVANAERTPIRVTIAARPWRQARSGRVAPDRRRTLRDVRLAARRFTLAPGQARVVPARLLRTPASGSAYGAVEVVGRPEGRRRGGVKLVYRLITSLRIDPVGDRLRTRLTVGRARITGRGRSRTLVVAVRNRGNSAAPVTGAVRLRGPRGTVRGAFPATRILPGSTVDLRLRPREGVPAGRLRAAIGLRQHGRAVVRARRTVR